MKPYKTNREYFHKTDKGIEIKELVKLIENNELAQSMIEILDINSIINETINIPGADKLYRLQKNINKNYEKIDIESNYKDIEISNEEDNFRIIFNNISENEYFKSNKISTISTLPKYATKTDFFASLYHMETYAKNLIDHSQNEILNKNFEMLKETLDIKRKFRLLRDIETNSYTTRAIVSLNNYNNYDNNITLVIALLVLHHQMQYSNIQYRINSCIYNESFIQIDVESTEAKEIEGVGVVRNLIRISNDEVKRSAMKFYAICSIAFKNTNNENKELTIVRTKDINEPIISVRHNITPQTVSQKLKEIDNAKNIHESLHNDILRIKQIRDADKIKHLILEKVRKAKKQAISSYKKELLLALDHKINNIIELLSMLHKLEYIVDDDLDAIQYIKYISYQALFKKGK